MANSYVNPIGMYPNLGYNDYQYLTAAMSTPNVNSPSFRGASASAQTTQVQPQVQYVQAEPQQKNNTGKVILGTLLVAGAALSIAAYRKGGDGAFFERIGKGFKMMFSKEGAAVTEKAAETATEAVSAGKSTIKEITLADGTKKTVVTLSGETNRITKSTPKAKDALNSLGFNGAEITKDCTVDSLLADAAKSKSKLRKGAELTSFSMEVEDEIGAALGKTKKKFTIIGAKGAEPKIYLDGKPFTTTTEGFTDDLYERLTAKAKDVWSGKTPLEELNKMRVRITDPKTGLVTTYKTSTAGSKSLKFITAKTDRFALDSTRIGALRYNNPDFDKLIDTLKNKGGEGLSILQADIPAAGHVFTRDINGNILAVKASDGTIYSLEKDKNALHDWLRQHKSTVDDLSKVDKKKWFNRILEIPISLK